MGWLKTLASPNMLSMFVTCEVSQPLMSALNDALFANRLDMSVMSDVSQSPYVVSERFSAGTGVAIWTCSAALDSARRRSSGSSYGVVKLTLGRGPEHRVHRRDVRHEDGHDQPSRRHPAGRASTPAPRPPREPRPPP